MSNETPRDKSSEREEKLRALHERLTSSVEQLVTGEDWKRAIEFAARFRSRSFNNTLLIYVQHLEAYEQGSVPNPAPTHVAGYKQWQQLERNVTKGQAGYQILAPVTARFASSNPADPDSWQRLRRREKPGPDQVVRTRMIGVRPAYVWDVSQTDGKPIPQAPATQLLQGQAPPRLRAGLIAQIEATGFTVVDVPDAAAIGGANGLTNYATAEVSVRTDMDDAAQVKTLAHELGHVLLHHPDNPDWHQHRGIGEVEAESFALMVGAAHGLDTTSYTVPYVASWAEGVPGKTPIEVVRATADNVCKTASQVLSQLQTEQVSDGVPDGLYAERRNITADKTVPKVNAPTVPADPPGPALATVVPPDRPESAFQEEDLVRSGACDAIPGLDEALAVTTEARRRLDSLQHRHDRSARPSLPMTIHRR